MILTRRDHEAKAAPDHRDDAGQEPVLVLKWNSIASRTGCALCGVCFKPDLGPELFLDGTNRLVCCDCGEKIAWSLVAVRWFALKHGIGVPAWNGGRDDYRDFDPFSC